MKERLLIPIISLLFLIGCNQKEEKKRPPIKGSNPTEAASKFDSLLPAYSITKDIDAIVLELDGYQQEHLFQNQIYNKVLEEDTLFSYESSPLTPINSTYIDTTGQFNIYRSEKLEKRIKEKLKPTYYVYGTKGFTRVSLGDVYFTVDECASNVIAIKLNGYDRQKYGNPMFCSENRVDLVYGTNYNKEQKAINKYVEKQNKLADYSNKPNCTKVYANIGSNYFTYEDDFNWTKDFSRDDINFPSREIFKIGSNGKIESIWGYCLDLFGIPCD